MSVCKGCLKPNVQDYCIRCRKLLFNGSKVSSVLPFPSPSKGLMKMAHNNINKISISGVQIKCSLLQQENKLQLTTEGGSHILKPTPIGTFQRLEEAPANEHITMQIAAQIFKISVAANALVYFEDKTEMAYITRRFDVLDDGSKNLQEDFAQIAGRTEENAGKNYKYNGSYEEMAMLMKKHIAAYRPIVERFFKIVLFNYLISNGDAHLKNFSLLRSPDGDYQLSPAYDLMCTALHTPDERHLAMEEGLYADDYKSPGHDAYGSHTRIEFQTFAERIGLIPRRAAAIIDNYLAQEAQVKTMVEKSFLSKEVQREYISLFNNKLRLMRQTP